MGRLPKRESPQHPPSHGQPQAAPQRNEDGDDAPHLFAKARVGDSGAIEELVTQYERVATGLARAHRGRGLSFEELFDQAKQGLRKAILEFNPTRADSFVDFANKVVRTGLADLLRSRSHCTPHERKQSAIFKSERLRLSHELGRTPTADETYDQLSWSHTQRRNHTLAERRRIMSSIDGPPDSHDRSQSSMSPTTPLSDFDAADIARVAEGVGKLNQQCREVIMERYYGSDHPSQKDTARRLGITEYRERQLEEQGLRALEHFLDSDATTAALDGNEHSEPGRGA